MGGARGGGWGVEVSEGCGGGAPSAPLNADTGGERVSEEKTPSPQLH